MSIKLNLREKLAVLIGKTKSEAKTSLRAWKALRPGDYVISRKTGMKRKCLPGTKNGFIHLMKIRESQYPSHETIYVDCDRYNFIIPSK